MSDPKLAIVAELGRLAELNAGLRVRWQAIAGAIRAQMLPLIRDRPPEEVFPAMVRVQRERDAG